MTHLKLVKMAPEIDSTEAGAVLRARPADRTESWTPRAEVLEEFAAVARGFGPGPNLAAVLVVERVLIAIENEERGLPMDLDRLDSAAATAQVDSELSGASADYLRALGGRSGIEAPQPVNLSIPMRLSDRILRLGIDLLLRPELLPSALNWERASVLAGMTMTEWVLSEIRGGA